MAEQTFKIGRGPNSDVIIADETISRLQAELAIRSDGTIVLTDCRSANGTCIFRDQSFQKIHHEIVQPNDIIKFGDVSWTIKDLLGAIVSRHPAVTIPPQLSQPVSGTLSVQAAPRMDRCPACYRVKPVSERCSFCD